MRECKTCKQIKEDTQFYYIKISNSDSGSCRDCLKEKAHARYLKQNPHRKRREEYLAAVKKPPEWRTEYDKVRGRINRLKKYGLTPEEADKILSTGCLACGAQDNIYIDHCHSTGKVRGALCRGCNAALGSLEESLDRLAKLKQYIEIYCLPLKIAKVS